MPEGRTVLVATSRTATPPSLDQAIYPHPATAPGAKLLSMIQEVDRAFSEADFLRFFDRVEVAAGSAADADPQGWWPGFVQRYRWRDIVVIGKPLLAATPLQKDWPFAVFADFSTYRVAWLPSPAGRNRFYNDRDSRLKVATFLRGLVRRV